MLTVKIGIVGGVIYIFFSIVMHRNYMKQKRKLENNRKSLDREWKQRC